MTFVLHILVAFLAPSLRDLGVEPLTVAPTWALGPGVLGLLLVPYVLAFSARRAGVRGRFRSASFLDLATRVSAPVLQVAAVFLLGWYDAVLGWTADTSSGPSNGDAWPGIALALTLLPYLIFELAAIDAHARSFGNGRLQIDQHRSLQLRLFASAIFPIVAFLMLGAALGANEIIRVHLEEVRLVYGVWTVLLLVLLALFMPRFLRRTWGTTPIAHGWARTILEETARRADFRCREYVIWNTGHQMANAAIVGVTPGTRVVFFTDALLARMGPRELAAVFAHEIGHARHHHAFVFASYLLFLMLGAGLIADELETESLQYGLFAVTFALWYVSFGYMSRRFELEADLNSVEVVGDSSPLINALEEVSGAHARTRGSWRHFSTAERVRRLSAMQAEPRLARALHRRLRIFGALGALGFLIVVAITFHGFFAALPTDRFVADVRLGRYESALARIADGAEIDARLVELVEHASAIPRAERTAEALDTSALRAATKGDLEEARDFAELGLLRGVSDLARVVTELQTRLDDTGSGGGVDLPMRWNDALFGAPPH